MVIAGVAVYAIVASLMNRIFFGIRENGIACGLYTLTFTGITVAFLLYEVVFIIWQVKGTKDASRQNEEIVKLTKISRLSLILAICLSLLFSVFCANTYTLCREDSISKVCFVTTKEYRWDERGDVLRYTFSCDEQGGLTFNITMKDGEVIELLGTQNSITEGFRVKFNASKVNLLSYAAHLADSFDESEFLIEKSIRGKEHMESFYKESRPEVWAEIVKIIE